MYSCQKPQSEKHSELFFRQEQQHREYTQLYGVKQHKEKKAEVPDVSSCTPEIGRHPYCIITKRCTQILIGGNFLKWAKALYAAVLRPGLCFQLHSMDNWRPESCFLFVVVVCFFLIYQWQIHFLSLTAHQMVGIVLSPSQSNIIRTGTTEGEILLARTPSDHPVSSGYNKPSSKISSYLPQTVEDMLRRKDLDTTVANNVEI